MTVQIRSSKAASGLDDNVVLRKALQRAGEELGLSAQETAQAIGKSRTFFEQGRAQNRIDPHTRPDAVECPIRHRLLLTPFRYRKRHGSRFTSRWERGLFYGSRTRFGCLLEGGYYALVFQSGPEQPFPRIVAIHKTLFHVEVSTANGLQLQSQRGKQLQRRLRDPIDTSFSQDLGREMREAGIEAFEYHSTRSQNDVVQFGALSCCVFRSTPFDQVDFQVEATVNEVAFRCLDDNSVKHFKREQFLVNGVLPQPSAS